MEDNSTYKTKGYMQIPICDKSVTSELSGDFTLPDYQPEIKRLLKIWASVLPASKYIGESGAEFAGNIDYYVLYTGSDNEVYCAPLGTEYKIDVPVEQSSDVRVVNMTGEISILPDMISGRVTSPRKLNVKCRLKARAQIYGDIPIDNGFVGVSDGGENQVLMAQAQVARAIFGTGEMLRVSDEMIVDTRQGDIRVICADGRAMISELACANGAVSCRGDLYLKLLMAREGGGDPYTSTRKIPFSQIITLDGADASCSASATASVCEMSISVEENKIDIDVGIMMEVCARKTESIAYVKDVYSTSRQCQCEYKAMTLPSAVGSHTGNFTLSDSVTLEEAGIVQGSEIIDSTGTAVCESVVFEDGKSVMSGKAKFNLLMRRDGEYSCSDVELPFRYVCTSGIGSVDECKASYEPSVISSRARIDGERIGIDAEIGVSGGAWSMGQIRMLDGISFGEEFERASGDYVICYPAPDDTLWSVAKRYGATVNQLMRNNKLPTDKSADSESSLDGVKYLIV